jgi:hypothetical protein
MPLIKTTFNLMLQIRPEKTKSGHPAITDKLSKNMLARISKAILAALSAVAAVKVAEYLTTNSPELGALSIILIAASVATILGGLFDEMLEFSGRRVPFLRKEFDPRARFEGVWIAHVFDLPDRPIAYVTISYNADADAYIYQGSAFNEKGELGSSWICPKIDFDLAKNEIRFVSEAQLVNAEAQGEISRSFGHIHFEKNFFGRKRRYSRGKGFFFDFGTQSRRAHFIVDRLDPKTVFDLIKKREVITHEDISELIRKASAQKNKTQVTSVPTS